MPSETYRYYSLDRAGHLHDAEWIEARDDKEAVAQVEALHSDATWELWHGTRLVGKLWPRRISA